nr:hypothetical protein [Tanacetum cinerariifolium]
MAFRLRNAGATYQALVDEAFRSRIGVNVVVQAFCLITGFAFGKFPRQILFMVCKIVLFVRVFPDKISKPLKKVRVLELLGLIKSPKMWFALSDEDSVKVCLLLGEYFWRALYRRLVNVINRHEVAVMLLKKKIIVPLKKKTKKTDSSKKIETYNVYVFFVSEDIYGRCTETANFGAKKIHRQPNDHITASTHGNQQIIYDASVHDPQFVQQSKQVVESVFVYTKLAVVKQRMNAIERFIKSRNNNMSEDSVAKQSIKKVIESSGGKADNAISDVCIGEISCENLVQEQ